jgi:molybdopterin synthase sulfur carrier subunit
MNASLQVSRMLLSGPLRDLAGGKQEIAAAGSTVRECLEFLRSEWPELGSALERDGRIARFVILYVGGEDVRALDGIDTAIDPGQTIEAVLAVSGG